MAPWRSASFWLTWFLGAVLIGAATPAVLLSLYALHDPALTPFLWQHQGFWPWRSWPRLTHIAALHAASRTIPGLAIAGWGYLRWKAEADRTDNPLASMWGTQNIKHTSYGSARWRRAKEWTGFVQLRPVKTLSLPRAGQLALPDPQMSEAVRRQGHPQTPPPGPGPGGIFLGQWGHQAALLTGDVHTLLIGIPGVGKTRRIILPTLAWLAQSQECLVLGDPKGELFSWAAKPLQDAGYAVLRFDLRHPQTRWNPLAPIIAALNENRLADASRAAWTLAHAIVGQQPLGGDNVLWSNTAETLIAALALAVSDSTATGLAPAEQHLFSAYQILMAHAQGQALDWYFDTTFPERHPAREAYAMIRTAAPETRQSIYVTATSTLRLFADPDMAWLTSAHDAAWPMGQRPTEIVATMQAKPWAIFCVIPDEDSTRYPIATLFLTQLIQFLVQAANVKGRLPRRVNFILDEFGNLPPIPDFDKALTVGRGRGLRFLLAVQALAQLTEQYDKKADILSGSCGMWIFLGTADPQTADTLSKKCGTQTIRTTQTSTQQGPQITSSSSEQWLGRPLVQPDEILRWPLGKTLILQTGFAPGVLTAPDLSAWKVLKDWSAAPDEEPQDLSKDFQALPRYHAAPPSQHDHPLNHVPADVPPTPAGADFVETRFPGTI
ncbi:VirD4-like conjugal transfer protein, CD1115 family [Sulfobacillus thermosulfidooxidans]|uniref:VirD4-like conjugal transfer protein, CD1115 family n=1 Tax=Sulfobacillus thermosulfidooxidans TaxID=28034 RepID=UPI0006B5842B|nr:type IV secretory system conjugative DNA transfer family protein [Sulfobacillus thermosulfidooxidans]